MKIISLIFLCFIISCGRSNKISKKERVVFSINDIKQNIKHASIEFKTGTKSFYFPIVNDSIAYSVDTLEDKFLTIHFNDSIIDLIFDSIPTNVIGQPQHINFEFGVRSKALLMKNSHIKRAFKYFSLNPQEYGLGLYWESPFNDSLHQDQLFR